jgi:hypothetical protein
MKSVFVLSHEQVIGVHSMFGGFFLGVITPRGNGFAMRMTERIEVRTRRPNARSSEPSAFSDRPEFDLTTLIRT